MVRIYHLVSPSSSFKGAVLVIVLFTIPATSYGDIYRYVDKHGRVHLTDRPKNSEYKRLVKTWKGWVEQPSYSISRAEFLRNKKKYSPAVEYVAREYDLPTPLLHAVITAESAYNPEAISRTGAAGLMQLMPETAKRYGVRNRMNPYQNIRGGSRYLRDLLLLFENDLILALAAYNAGENAVKRHGNKVPPYRETRNYVDKVLKFYKEYQQSS